MSKVFRRSLHIFRRDLRLQDNRALLAALEQSGEVIAGFFFDPRQVEEHEYRSAPAFQHMIESLECLDECLRSRDSQLYCWRGVVEEIILTAVTNLEIDAVFFNRDYTPFARKRDDAIEAVLSQHNIAVRTFHDALLTAPGSVLKGNGDPYVKYTPFLKKAATVPVDKPKRNMAENFYKTLDVEHSLARCKPDFVHNPDACTSGGRNKAMALLQNIGTLDAYMNERNFPAKGATTGLSVAMKFGTVSVREFYYAAEQAFDSGHPIINELYWRDFFTHIGFHFPHVFSGCFHKKYDGLIWSRSKKKFAAWCEGKTGHPLVDAGMRELNRTGYMHNRVRMVTASFLTKDLHIDWRKGERYFATQLIDYDPAVNNGNWQWVASTGCDAQPYFRIFNPWRQLERFDPQCEYVKKWVPELAGSLAKEIFSIEKGKHVEGYVKPIVKHAEEKERAEDRYRAVS